jgi:hypothetical protein
LISSNFALVSVPHPKEEVFQRFEKNNILINSRFSAPAE